MSVAVAVNNPVNSLIQAIHEKFVAGLSQQKANWLGKRPDRALALAKKGSVLPTGDADIFRVFSSSDESRIYLVNLKERTCTCPDCSKNGYVCKHRIAAYYFREAAVRGVVQNQEEDHPQVVHRLLAHQTRMEGDYIVYAWFEMQNAQEILVEILETIPEINTAYVRALPTINAEGELEGLFPFPSPFEDSPNGNIPLYSTAHVSKNLLKNVRVCQKGYSSN